MYSFSIKDTENIWIQNVHELKSCRQRCSSVQLGLQDFAPGLNVQRHHRGADELVSWCNVAEASCQPGSLQTAAAVVLHQG